MVGGTPEEFRTFLLADIEKLMKRQLEQVVIPGFEPDLSVEPEPLRKVRPPRPPRAGGKPGGSGNAPTKSGGSKPGNAPKKPGTPATNKPAPANKPSGNKPAGGKPAGSPGHGPRRPHGPSKPPANR